AGGAGAEDAVGAHDTEGEGIDEDDLVVAGIEVDLAANRRHAAAIAVPADATHHAADEIARARMIEAAEAQRVEVGNRARAHGEDVAHDAADAGRRALIGLDERRMV